MYLIYFVTFFTLPLSELILVGLVLDRHMSVSFRAEESQLCLRFFVIKSISDIHWARAKYKIQSNDEDLA